MTVEINGRETTVGNQLKTVGDLVAFVDETLAASGEVVTALRLDEVDEAAFRDPQVCRQRLSGFRAIQVESGSPQALARRCLGDAAQALGSLSQATHEAAGLFRGDDIAQAKAMLEQVSHGLMAVLRIVSAASLALRRELDGAGADGRSIASLSAELDRILQNLVASQQDEDWLQVADVLQYDLGPVLDGWGYVLTEVAAA
ncbi:MAG: hypothetical protein Q7V01_01070 [Vicinamibacterales bacterium]|nr:hypothetical protein [Vicinamibacterales bacterium]